MKKINIFLTAVAFLFLVNSCKKEVEVLKKEQQLTFLLPQVHVTYPTVNVTITGSGNFKVFRGDSLAPVETFTLQESSHELKFDCTRSPEISIRGDIGQITGFNVGSPFPGRLGILNLDLGMAVKLKNLVLASTFLTSLDLSNNTELEQLSLEATMRYECRINSLNLGNNKKLKDFSFTNILLTDIVWPNVSSDGLNKFYIDLAKNVDIIPRSGTILSPPPTGDGLVARDNLVNNHGWTVRYYDY